MEMSTRSAGRPDKPIEVAARKTAEVHGDLKVARRTVTKYRQLLRIEPADRRRGNGEVLGETVPPTELAAST